MKDFEYPKPVAIWQESFHQELQRNLETKNIHLFIHVHKNRYKGLSMHLKNTYPFANVRRM